MTKQMLKVKGEEGLVRDPSSKAILNTDIEALHKHRRKRQAFRDIQRQQEDVLQLQQDVSNIKTELSNITSLLTKILEDSRK